MESKIDERDWWSSSEQIAKKLSGIQEDLSMKPNIKDVCILFDQKANIDDVNKALEEIHSELDQKANETVLSLSVKE